MINYDQLDDQLDGQLDDQLEGQSLFLLTRHWFFPDPFHTAAHCTLRCCTPSPHCVEQGDHSPKRHASQALALHGSSEGGLCRWMG